MPATPNKPYFKLYACCIPVKGAARTVICDLQRTELQPVPNDLYDILVNYKDTSVDQIKADYEPDAHAAIDEYFDFLEKEEFGFWCSNPSLFPAIDLHWESPLTVTNAIVDTTRHSAHDYKNIIQQLSGLGCAAVQFRFYDHIALDALRRLLDHVKGSRLTAVELILPYYPALTIENIESFLAAHSEVSSFIVHSASRDELITTKDFLPVYFTRQVVSDHTHCGIIDKGYFSVNLPAFAEAQQFNSCLNRKISIDVNGNIKNCPSMQQSFGNIAEVLLSDVVNLPAFRSVWYLHKNQVAVCRDCEFRYVCSDCRAYTQDNALNGKPARCGYNPYTMEWE